MLCFWSVGCSSRSYFGHHQPSGIAPKPALFKSTEGPRSLPIFRADTGAAINWQGLLEAIEWADVGILGEQHDDAVAHAVQLAVVEDAMRRYPGTALSMEMLDREEQALVDDYLADFINRDRFLEQTASTKWLRIARDYLDDEIDRETFQKRILRIGWPDWENNYQPIIDAARSAGAPVIAANTPWLVYSSVARREGFERLDDVTPAQRALFEVPAEIPQGTYRERFWDVMVGRAEGEPPPDDADDNDSAHSDLDDETVAAMFRGQLVMDATMAESIATASRAGAPKVVHLVGHFHCDFEGGLVQELRRRLPDAEILVITALARDEPALRDEDVDRADFVVYTKR